MKCEPGTMKFGNFCRKNVLYTLLSEKIKMLFSEPTLQFIQPWQQWRAEMGEQMDQCNGEQILVSRRISGEQRPGAETPRRARERESSQLRGGSGARHMVEQLLSARDHSDRSNSIF